MIRGTSNNVGKSQWLVVRGQWPVKSFARERTTDHCQLFVWNFGGAGMYPGGVPLVMKGKSSGFCTKT